jgi:hypothetical protein
MNCGRVLSVLGTLLVLAVIVISLLYELLLKVFGFDRVFDAMEYGVERTSFVPRRGAITSGMLVGALAVAQGTYMGFNETTAFMLLMAVLASLFWWTFLRYLQSF